MGGVSAKVSINSTPVCSTQMCMTGCDVSDIKQTLCGDCAYLMYIKCLDQKML